MMPFNMNPQQLLQSAMQRNPNIANNPQAQQYIQVLMSGDAQRGEELARNICNTYGISPEQGLRQAQSFFQSKFQGG